ncbi:gamma-glutamyl-gamma-aminobutyrate hydrolase family protein [Lacticaseibacillus daqingensis]|uniref:gamma-glutamyl-gamma-aminobutyrate hydrolase family protein n=1 Tax=Lacticaseibacillus daqingensis TaxID=2486014 RepID=UPI000F7B9DB0|nr:gamma-glutamyl-gamma-aminobutyrate hydrolase family protein [Lacticaseibacillus daqingensis]
MRPIIAVTTDTIPDPSVNTKPNTVDIAPTMFKDTILQAGGVPIIIPYPSHPGLIDEMIAAYLPLFDGLLLPGGPDVDPTLYGEQPSQAIGETNPPRDQFELALIRATHAARKPMFGLCRGSHILNVAFGGTLYQDLATQNPAALRHLQRTSGEYPTHHVNIAANSRLQRQIGATAYVNSRHHQAVRTVGRGMRVAATALDGTIEAFESIDDDLVLGLQWHPENLWATAPEQLNIYHDFIQRTLAHRIHRQAAAPPATEQVAAEQAG